MSTTAQEAARLVESLPPQKAEAVLEFARYLAEKEDEEEWDRRLSSAKYVPKLQSRLAKVDREIAAGQAKPLDVERL
jgi:hypothetical protein